MPLTDYVVNDDPRQDSVPTNIRTSPEKLVEEIDSEWGWFDDELLLPRPTFESDVHAQSRRATRNGCGRNWR